MRTRSVVMIVMCRYYHCYRCDCCRRCCDLAACDCCCGFDHHKLVLLIVAGHDHGFPSPGVFSTQRNVRQVASL